MHYRRLLSRQQLLLLLLLLLCCHADRGVASDKKGSAKETKALKDLFKVRVVTFSFLCPLLEKCGTFIARCNALIEKVSTFKGTVQGQCRGE
eukprot:SAG31_NODE_9423_length_1278_cov_4.667515_1_plen_91_part_10